MMKENNEKYANPYETYSDWEDGDIFESIKPKAANPAPLGLLGFGMATILLNLHNAGIIELSVMIVAMGFAAGGLMQIIAGVFDMKQGNTFGGTAFIAYGCFWWSLIFIWFNPGEVVYEADEMSMGYYLLLWGVFTLFMYVGTRKHTRATQVVFLTLTILFFGLAAHNFLMIDVIGVIAGYIGIFCGASAIYNAMGQMLKVEYGREILKLG